MVDNNRISVLVLEDDKIDRMAFERMVRENSLPYDYTCVGSLKQCLNALESHSYDVLVSDYRLGDGTALDLFDKLDPDLPVIVVTGAGGEEIAVEAMKSGASDYLLKDVDGAYLKTLPLTLENTIKAKRNEIELRRHHEQLEALVEERTAQVQKANKELLREIEEKKRAEKALQAAHDKLEIKVQERTSELLQSNKQLKVEIQEKEKAREGLRKSKETVEAILNGTSDCAFLLSTDGEFVALNQPTAESFNSATEHLIGKNYFETIPKQVATNRRERFEQVIKERSAARFEDTWDSRHYDHRYHPVFDSDGSVERIAVFLRDVTDQKNAAEMLVQRQRLAALGEMAGGVAHNFNNLLQIIIGATGLAQTEMELGNLDETRETLDQIVESSQMGAETVKQLQDFARVRTENPTVSGKIFDISNTADRAIEVCKPFWKTNAERKGIRIDVKRRLPPGCFVNGMQNELFEVIVNLIKNATEALPKGGEISVTSRISDDWVILKVEDNGTGIANENLNKVFEPFWTTKGVQGTGMGLSTSLGIITRHGGSIEVDSAKGKGTSFTIQLPLASKPDEASQQGLKLPDDFHARFLIADDNDRIADLLERGLNRLQQTVYRANSGRQALEYFRKNEVDIIICDLGMPEMNGWVVGKRIKRYCSKRELKKPPFVLCTGWGMEAEDSEKIEESGVDHIARKPLKFKDLLEIIHKFLI